MRKQYPSDITHEQFGEIRPLLESGRKKTAPIDLCEVFCAILYLLKSGCQWRMLPEVFLKWSTVYYYFSIWNKPADACPSLLHRCLKKIIGKVRKTQGRKSCKTSFLIVDAQSVKIPTAPKAKAMMRAKKISGIKRHIAVDTQAFPHALAVPAANVTDRKRTLLAFEHNKDELTGKAFCVTRL